VVSRRAGAGAALRLVPWLVTAAALALGAWRAAEAWWTTDDAFISFRYARNLVEGQGLVFNPGERVEGFTNLLWTLWVAAGLALGAGAEAWANACGLAAYLATGVLLTAAPRLVGSRLAAGALPIAALGAALHPDWIAWATGGLETSAFTLLALTGCLLAARGLERPRWQLAAGAALGLAALTRPDGVLLAAVTGTFALLFGRPRLGAGALHAAGFLVPWLPATAWRVAYYGDFFPNTYYAKSAYLAWYEQGWHYLTLYYARYWPLLLAPALLALAALLERRRRGLGAAAVADPARGAAWLGLAMATVYTAYVVRVGGDFMYARLLVPTAPLLLLGLEQGCLALAPRRPWVGACLGAGLLAALALTPHPLPGPAKRHGVSNERAYYSPARVAALDHMAEVLGRAFAGLPVRVAFFGSEARVAYRARFPVAIESRAGLTDREIARQPLAQRGRVGHEKLATPSYLIERRRAHITFHPMAPGLLDLDRAIPRVYARFDARVVGRLLHWDPPLMDALRARGVEIQDFPAMLDATIAGLDASPDHEVQRSYQQLRRFYFLHVDDPEREAAFLRRLAAAAPTPP